MDYGQLMKRYVPACQVSATIPLNCYVDVVTGETISPGTAKHKEIEDAAKQHRLDEDNLATLRQHYIDEFGEV